MNKTTSFRIGSKDILARAMATEDITVEHRADAETAYFDVQSRTLILPMWKDMSSSMYDMLVGHEVSHALNTPADGWMDWVGESPMKKMILNVVEDARIERLIKDAFPGIRRDFAAGYQSFYDQDIFQIKNVDLDDLSIIDRLNLHFKIGLFNLVTIQFAADEQQFVTRMAETVTFEDVMTLCQDLYDILPKEIKEKDTELVESENGKPTIVEMDEDGDGTLETGESEESGEDSDVSMEDDTDDGESAESKEGDPQAGKMESDNLKYEDYSNEVGQTQKSFERGVRELRDVDGRTTTYHTLPNVNLDSIIVDFPVIEKLWNDLSTSDNTGSSYYETNIREIAENSKKRLHQFQNQSKPIVNHMVQQFQMRQAADADKRTEVAKTGILDTTSMINYRWSEDIFLKNESHTDGKNHGIIIFLDWSASMSRILDDTVQQLLILVEFCRKAGIPYEVYAFSSNAFVAGMENCASLADKRQLMDNCVQEQWIQKDDSDVKPHLFTLLTFLSSRMNTKQHKTAVKNLWNLSTSQTHYYMPRPNMLDLGSTPLNEAIVAGMDIIPAFQKKTGVQICNLILLTDGEGHSINMHGTYNNDTHTYSKSILRDKITKRTYTITNETGALIECLRDRTGCNVIGIRLHDSNNLGYVGYMMAQAADGTVHDYKKIENIQKIYKKQKFVVLELGGYNSFFVVQGNIKMEFDALENLDDDASYTKIKNAFIKGSNSKKVSRTLATKIVEIIA